MALSIPVVTAAANTSSIAEFESVISALIAGSVSLSIGYLTYRRISRATKAEQEERASEASNTQIEVIREAWESVVQQLRDEVSRLENSRSKERQNWQERERALQRELAELHAEVERCQNKIAALEAEVSRLQRDAYEGGSV